MRAINLKEIKMDAFGYICYYNETFGNMINLLPSCPTFIQN